MHREDRVSASGCHTTSDSTASGPLSVGGRVFCGLHAGRWLGRPEDRRPDCRQSSVNVTEREQVSRLLNDLSNDIWLTETALQGFLLSPEKQQRTTTLATIDHLINDTRNLSITDWTKRSPSRHDRLQRLSEDIQELRRQSDRLMEIRANAEMLFPAMRHMLDKMLPNNIRFLTYATLAMDEARERRGAPSQEEISGCSRKPLRLVDHDW